MCRHSSLVPWSLGNICNDLLLAHNTHSFINTDLTHTYINVQHMHINVQHTYIGVQPPQDLLLTVL